MQEDMRAACERVVSEEATALCSCAQSKHAHAGQPCETHVRQLHRASCNCRDAIRSPAIRRARGAWRSCRSSLRSWVSRPRTADAFPVRSCERCLVSERYPTHREGPPPKASTSVGAACFACCLPLLLLKYAFGIFTALHLHIS